MIKEISTINDFVMAINNINWVVIDFYANWCGPCKIIASKYAEMEKKYPNVKFYKLNCDNKDVGEIVDKYEISSLPTFCFFKNGRYIYKITTSDDRQVESLLQKLLSAKIVNLK